MAVSQLSVGSSAYETQHYRELSGLAKCSTQPTSHVYDPCPGVTRLQRPAGAVASCPAFAARGRYACPADTRIQKAPAYSQDRSQASAISDRWDRSLRDETPSDEHGRTGRKQAASCGYWRVSPFQSSVARWESSRHPQLRNPEQACG